MEQNSQEQSVGCHSAEGLSVSVSAQTGGHTIAPVVAHTTVSGNLTILSNVYVTTNTENPAVQGPVHSSVVLRAKAWIRTKYAYVTEYNSRAGEHVLLGDRYTELLIIQKHREQDEREREICFTGERFFSARDNERYSSITVEQFFNPDKHGHIPKTVILQGNSGNGKSFTVQKIMLDWASDKLYAENFDSVFHLKCKEINQISGEKSLVDLLRYRQTLTSAQISQILQHSPERVLFLIDGFDELRLSQDNMSNLSLPTDIQTPASPESTVTALLSGFLLPESFLLVTTRSTATDRLSKLLEEPLRFTEIMGFSERGVKEYFQRFFKDDQLLQTQPYELVKANETLFTACFIPVICWIICTVLRERHKDGRSAIDDLDTTTSIYVGFVSTLLEHHYPGLSQSVPSLLRSLGQLAERGMVEQQVLFDEESVHEAVPQPANIPFLCKFLFKREIFLEEMFSFMHLSFQEFFTALYYVLLSEEQSEKAVKELFQPEDKLFLLPVIQFLCGLSSEKVSSSLRKTQRLSISPSVKAQLKEWVLESVKKRSGPRDGFLWVFILHCLYELHEEDFVRKAMESWERIDLSGIPLRRTDCWVLQYCLQFCPQIKSLNLIYCTLKAEKLKILQPTVCRSEELQLWVEDLSDGEADVLVSALGEGKDLTELSVQNSTLSDQGVEQVLSSLNKQRTLGKVYLTVKAITTNTAGMITEFIHNKQVKKLISLEVNEESGESLCSALGVSVAFGIFQMNVEGGRRMSGSSEVSSPQTKPSVSGISLTCPHSETSNIDWARFLRLFHKIKDLTDICPEASDHFDGLRLFLQSQPGLRRVFLRMIRLTENWVPRIISIVQTCPGLQEIRVEMNGDDSLFSSLSLGVIHGDFKLYVQGGKRISRSSEISSPQTEPSVSGIRLTCPHSEISNINWASFLQLFHKIKDLTDMSLKSDEQFDSLLFFLHSEPGLKEVDLEVNRLTESWAVRIISLIQTCPSLQKIRIKVGFLGDGLLLEEGIRSLQHSEKRPDCTLTLTGTRCTKPTDQSTEDMHTELTCKQRVKLQLRGESFTELEE